MRVWSAFIFEDVRVCLLVQMWLWAKLLALDFRWSLQQMMVWAQLSIVRIQCTHDVFDLWMNFLNITGCVSEGLKVSSKIQEPFFPMFKSMISCAQLIAQYVTNSSLRQHRKHTNASFAVCCMLAPMDETRVNNGMMVAGQKRERGDVQEEKRRAQER